MLTGPKSADPADQVDARTLRPRGFSDDARALLEHVIDGRAVRQVPAGDARYAGAAAGPAFATEQALAELKAISAATIGPVPETGPGQDGDHGQLDDWRASRFPDCGPNRVRSRKGIECN